MFGIARKPGAPVFPDDPELARIPLILGRKFFPEKRAGNVDGVFAGCGWSTRRLELPHFGEYFFFGELLFFFVLLFLVRPQRGLLLLADRVKFQVF